MTHRRESRNGGQTGTKPSAPRRPWRKKVPKGMRRMRPRASFVLPASIAMAGMPRDYGQRAANDY